MFDVCKTAPPLVAFESCTVNLLELQIQLYNVLVFVRSHLIVELSLRSIVGHLTVTLQGQKPSDFIKGIRTALQLLVASPVVVLVLS
jgi:hypothetical protein